MRRAAVALCGVPAFVGLGRAWPAGTDMKDVRRRLAPRGLTSGWTRALTAALLCALLAALNLMAWQWANPPLPAAQAQMPVSGLAYNGFQRWQSPLQQQWPARQSLEDDLALLSKLTNRLRTYSASEVPELVDVAREHGFRLTAGVWLDTQAQRNARELKAVEAAVARDRLLATAGQRASSNASIQAGRVIERVIVGNETQLHGLVPITELLILIRRLQGSLDVPVSTAEPWHVWLREPELAEAVDFIAVHLLPYWEGVPAAVAVHEVWRRYDELRQRYPHKPVVIAEVGWPSSGALVEKRIPGALNQAQASPLEQAQFLREFVASAQQRTPAVDYFLMEAIDQPWKAQTEGSVGAHWGVLDARRQPKFEWSGSVDRDPHWRGKALMAALLGALVFWPFCMRMGHMRLAGRMAFGISAQAVASGVVVLATLPLGNYLELLDAVLLAILAPALLLMAAILLSHAFEFAELFWDGNLQHRAEARPHRQGQPHPMVSIHLACCNEPPDMVLATIKSLQALDWPRLEILIVDNNSSDPRCWQPIQAYVEDQRRAGDHRLRFIHLPQWPGYKAGALNEALRRTDPQAQWVAVVDADYVVHPHWLRRLAGWFESPDVAVVQCPQAHRDWNHSRLTRMMNWEYEGFFRLGMHHRHERNAIVQHGTMTLIRSRALRGVGGWNPECVCEDTELGLRLLEQGGRKVYVDDVMGTGLVPRDFAAYQRQRERWARGGMQILRGHAGALFGPSRLSLGQRYHFVAGWLPWIGDTLHLLFTLTALLWSLGAAWWPGHFELPLPLLALPLLVFFTARLVVVPVLYLKRVQCSLPDVLGAAWAGMALSHRIARGVLAGLWGGRAIFHVTAKAALAPAEGPNSGVQRATGRATRWARWTSVREEAGLLTALLLAVGLMAWTTPAVSAPLVSWWVILVLQALPYGAALSCAALSAPRLGSGAGGAGTVIAPARPIEPRA